MAEMTAAEWTSFLEGIDDDGEAETRVSKELIKVIP